MKVCVFFYCEPAGRYSSQIKPALTRRLKFHLGRPEDLMKTLINITLLHSPLTDINLTDRYTNRQQAGEQKPAEPKQSNDTPSHPCFTTWQQLYTQLGEIRRFQSQLQHKAFKSSSSVSSKLMLICESASLLCAVTVTTDTGVVFWHCGISTKGTDCVYLCHTHCAYVTLLLLTLNCKYGCKRLMVGVKTCGVHRGMYARRGEGYLKSWKR